MDSLKKFILSGWILVLIGCHNNAHLRTQKILEKKESVISVSGVLPIGGIDDRYSIDDENGILGMRGELSYIKGFGNYELGPYAGFGLSDLDDPGFILGFDYKNYLNISSNRPIKFGAQFELNSSEYGQIFHIKPSLISVTNQKKAGYYGIHGLLYNGSLKLWGSSVYNYSSLGVGFTLGTEYISSKSSIQAQVDLSMVNNAFQIEGGSYFFYMDEWIYDPGDSYHLIVGLSAGVNFFNAPEERNKFFEPMPVPNYKKVKTKDIYYNPNTGEVISSGPTKFDPNTGELLSSQTEIFDPNTGEKIIKHQERVKLSNDTSKFKINESLTDKEVINLAYINGTKDYVSPVWTLSGIASIPAAFAGSILGGIMAFEIMDLHEIGFLGLFGGGVAGFSAPYILSKNTDVSIIYPPNITDKRQINIYKKTYDKKIKERRSKKIKQSQNTCILIPGFGLLALIFLI